VQDKSKFSNIYVDASYASAYAQMAFPGTYYLAYRDIPQIISTHITGRRALDFGCGAGRSTRLLQRLGFNVLGIDISEEMITQARAADPDGDYRLIGDGDVRQLEKKAYDLILAAFTFDNIPTLIKKIELFSGLGDSLNRDGRVINLVSSPDIYLNEWTSFSTRDFPENRAAANGDIVRIVVTDLSDQRPVEDILWTDDAWRQVYARAGLEVVEALRPLAINSEPFEWINETRIAPWAIYVLQRL